MLFYLASLLDPHFRSIALTPDNVPIAMMLFAVLFFTWYGLKQGVENDRYLAKGEDFPLKAEAQKKVFVWPDLVYIELMCIVVMTVFLIVWSIGLKAPLEAPANPAMSPNPSKAPWYFLGLQEMLVYFDPWYAGVLLPGLIIVGLAAIPYIDVNPKGSGYYTFKERKFAIIAFLFGFLVLWVSLIVLGTFLRGPNWNFFGPFEKWDVHKVVPLLNVNLSEIIWVKLFRISLPQNWLVREFFGLILAAAYLLVPPLWLTKRYLKDLFEKMGPARYGVLMFLVMMMASLPIKMLLRWAFNLKYIVSIPEFFFNI
ncbi:MAG: cytochrome C [Deltaproteobacteria bacterium]|nr:cytochrome C [Deltaproteobacteria bacterium]